MTVDLIVSSYRENLDWLKSLSYDFTNIFIYNKYEPIEVCLSNCVIIHLPNIGREAQTYLYHIINNYETLSDYNIFVQGSPAFQNINREIRSMINMYNIYNYQTSSNYKISNRICLDKNDKLLLWRNDNLLDTGLNFFDWYLKYIGNEIPNKPYKIYFQANFGVSKKNIMLRPKSYYQNLIDQLTENNTEAAHFLERSWYYIFNP